MDIDLWLDDAKIEVFRVAGTEEFVPWRGHSWGNDDWNFFLSFEKRGNDVDSTPWRCKGLKWRLELKWHQDNNRRITLN